MAKIRVNLHSDKLDSHGDIFKPGGITINGNKAVDFGKEYVLTDTEAKRMNREWAKRLLDDSKKELQGRLMQIARAFLPEKHTLELKKLGMPVSGRVLTREYAVRWLKEQGIDQANENNIKGCIELLEFQKTGLDYEQSIQKENAEKNS